MVIKCDPRAYAKCPTRHLCGTYCDDVCFEEGSECDAFNQEMINAPQTNADRIRAMSDEELAQFLDDTQRMECESIHVLNGDGTLKYQSLVNGWLRWLQQPAEEVQENAG